MQRDLGTFLWDIDEAITSITSFVNGRDLNHFESDDMMSSAVEFKLLVIGEAIRQMLERFPAEAAPLGLFTSLIGFQVFLIRQYAKVDKGLVWDAVCLLPNLQSRVRQRMAELEQ